jgi:hypothetical protein
MRRSAVLMLPWAMARSPRWKIEGSATANGAVLYKGDTATSMAGRETVFCIAVQHAEESVLRAVKSALANDPKFTAVCAPPRFVEGAACTSEPLVMAGKVSGGEILGDAWNSRPVRRSGENATGE